MRILLVILLLAVSALAQEKAPASAPKKAPAAAPEKASAPAPAKAPAAAPEKASAPVAGKTPAATPEKASAPAPGKAPAAVPDKASAAAPEKAPAAPSEKALAASQQTPAQGPPPKNLTKLPDGHFSANSDPRDVESFEVRVVAAGDTLSGIAKDVLKDGKLWPQIWEQNEHIVNPHWIYPNDKILIRPVTRISDAKPPEPETPPLAPLATPEEAPQAAQNQGPQPLKGTLVPAPYPNPLPPAGPRTILNLDPPKSFPEVKQSDINCAGFIRAEDVASDLKIVGRYSDDQPLATEGDYVYIGRGAEAGIRPGTTYEVLRPTKSVKGLGMHYLEVAQVQIVMGQADNALARITQGCESVEIGDILVPFNKVDFPALPAKRPFSGTMTASGQIPGNVIMTKDSVVNSRSKVEIPSTSRRSLKTLDKGIVAEGSVVYLDVGKQAGAKPGDLFIVFRDHPKVQNIRTAIAEVVILKVEDASSSALVTYSDDAISLGDVVERR
jgi:LysM domain